MLPATDALYLYHLTLRAAEGTLHAIEGNFSGRRKAQELVVSTTTGLAIHAADAATGKLRRLQRQAAFATVQRLHKIRAPGSRKDLLVVTSDAGTLTVAELDTETYRFVPVLQEPVAKPALRDAAPGHHVAADPHGRALMVAALADAKLVYRAGPGTAQVPVALALPLETGARGTLTLDVCALDTAPANPAWAALEVTCAPPGAPAPCVVLYYYELDAALNHVTRRRSTVPVPQSARLVVPVPAPTGGVLVCCDSLLVYEQGQGGDRQLVQLPVRAGTGGTQVVAHAAHRVGKHALLVLLQSAAGDLFRVSVCSGAQPRVTVTYFDSIPPCTSIHVFAAGFLYAHTLGNNKLVYQIERLGADGMDGTDSSNDSVVDATTAHSEPWSEAMQQRLADPAARRVFAPVGLQNLALVDIVESLAPVMGSSLVAPTRPHDSPAALATLSSHAHIKTLVHGTPVLPLVASPLPMAPTAVYTTSALRADAYDRYLVLSSLLAQSTTVLAIGEVVEEVAASGLVLDQHTLAVHQMGSATIAQVHRNGIRTVRHTLCPESGAVTARACSDWFPPAGITVLHAAANNEQAVVALSNREVCYFEIDPADGQLSEYLLRYEAPGGAVTAVAITCNPAGRKSDFLAVATADDSMLIISLAAHNRLDVLTLQALSSSARSLVMLASGSTSLHVHIGMDNGVYARASVDTISGKLADTRLKYLGTAPVVVRELRLPNTEHMGVLAISSRPWVAIASDSAFRISPLIDCDISCGASLFSEDIGVESIVGIRGSELSIFTLGADDVGGFDASSDFVVSLVKLRYTPKKHVHEDGIFYVLESDYNVMSPYLKDTPVDDDYIEAFGLEAKPGAWASCIQVVGSEVLQSIELENNECALALCLMEVGQQKFLVVTTTKDLNPSAPTRLGNFLYAYSIEPDKTLGLCHKTALDIQATALESLGDKKLLVAAENQLRVYELGKKQFLRKSATKFDLLRRVNKIMIMAGDIVVAGDAQNSLVFFQYDSVRNSFTAFANDVMSRQVTTFEPLDNRTVIGGDKFGNIFVNRIPSAVFEQMADNVLLKFQDEFLNGAPARTSRLCEFYVQDIPTSFHRGTFVVGGTESIIYTGIQGTIGLLMPLATKHEVQFVVKLENAMRKVLGADFSDLSKTKRAINLVGREHAKFRGYYNPAKNVVDGDFVEKFYDLDQATKIKIAGQLDRAPRDVERKLYDLRNRAAF